MALALLCRQCHRLKNIKSLIALQVNGQRILQPGNILTNNNNKLPSINEEKQIRCFSLTQPKYSGNAFANHWKSERYLSIALLGIMPVAFLYPSTMFDYLLAIGSVTHFHFGIDGIITDYVRPILFGHTFPKIAHLIILLMSLLILFGLIHFIRNDIGLINGIKSLWAVPGYDPESKENQKPENRECPRKNAKKN